MLFNRFPCRVASALAMILATAACDRPGPAGAANETMVDKAASNRPPSSAGHTLALPASQEKADFGEGTIRFIGNATVLIQYAGITILTDPNFLHKGGHVHLGYGLTAERLTSPAMTMDQLPPIDFVLLSHAHGDHFDQVVQAKLAKTIPIVTTPGASSELRELGFLRQYPLRAFDTLTVSKGDASLRVTAMPARHGPPLIASTLPETMGSMLEFVRPDGTVAYRMYISGDTLMYDEIEEIASRYPDIDLALLHLGGTRILNLVMVTMDGEQGVRMLKMVAPRHAIPVHYNDYDIFKSPIEDFQQRVREAGLREKVTYLRHGERYSFHGRTD